MTKNITVYTSYSKSKEADCYNLIVRMALHPMDGFDNTTVLKEDIWPFRVVYCATPQGTEASRECENYDWKYSCLGSDVREVKIGLEGRGICVTCIYGDEVEDPRPLDVGKRYGDGSYEAAMLWLLGGEK